jgi:hypothetical protein
MRTLISRIHRPCRMRTGAARKDRSKQMTVRADANEETIREENEGKHIRTRRTWPLPGLASKISELAAVLAETARLEHERNRKDDGRVRAILATATGGAIERLLRSMNLSETDREFLREKGWRV